MQTTLIRRVTPGALTVLLVLAALHAQLELRRSWVQQRDRSVGELQLPSSQLLRLATLNYTTFAADLSWIAMVVHHGNIVVTRNRSSGRLLKNAHNVASLDPDFYRLYEWVPGAFINRRYPVTADDLEQLNDFMDRGVQNFPDDADLRLSAALHYVGYGKDFSDETRIRQSERAIAYLTDALEAPNATEEIPAVLAWFRYRKQRLEKGGISPEERRKQEIEFYTELLSTTMDPRLRKVAMSRLKAMGAEDREVMARSRKQMKLFDDARAADLEYVPGELWIQLMRERGDG